MRLLLVVWFTLWVHAVCAAALPELRTSGGATLAAAAARADEGTLAAWADAPRVTGLRDVHPLRRR